MCLSLSSLVYSHGQSFPFLSCLFPDNLVPCPLIAPGWPRTTPLTISVPYPGCWTLLWGSDTGRLSLLQIHGYQLQLGLHNPVMWGQPTLITRALLFLLEDYTKKHLIVNKTFWKYWKLKSPWSLLPTANFTSCFLENWKSLYRRT